MKEGAITTTGSKKLLPCCKVTNVDAAKNMITVQDNKTGKVIRMRLGSSKPRLQHRPGTKKYRRGQTVYMNDQGNLAAVTTFPVSFTKKNKIEKSSRTMETTVILSDSGRMDGRTKIKTSEALRGFTGGVQVVVTDLGGNQLYTTKMRTYGVDGTANPNNNSSRTEKWTEQVPTEALDKAAALVIWHSHEPKNRIPGAVEWVKDNWDCFVVLYKLLKTEDGGAQPGGGQPGSQPLVLPGGGQPGGGQPGGLTDEEWGPAPANELKDILSECKNLFGN